MTAKWGRRLLHVLFECRRQVARVWFLTKVLVVSVHHTHLDYSAPEVPPTFVEKLGAE